jgi:hypothetical protein
MRRAGALSAYFDLPVRVMDQDGWIDAASLFQGDDARLRDMVTTYGRERWGTNNPHVAGSAFIIAFLTRVTWPVIAQYVLERRVPKVTLDNLALHRDGERIAVTALSHPSFALLPSDPAASHQDAEVVADEAALYGRLKEWLFESNLTTVISALRRAARASIRVSKNAVAASCAQAFNRLYSVVDNPNTVADEAYAFFSDPTSLVHREVTIELFEHQEKRGLFSRRAGCCLWWRSEKSNDYCSNCVLLPRERQDDRFREILARRR